MMTNIIPTVRTHKHLSTLIPALFLFVAGMSVSIPSEAAPKRYDYAEETNTSLREVRDGLDDLKHEVSNHETEIRTFEEKLENQATTLDSLRQQIQEATQANKELVRSTVNGLETKFSGIETTTKGLIADTKQFKTHANDASASIEQYEQRIARLEKIIEVQNKNIANLEAALNSIAGAFDVKDAVAVSSSVTKSSTSSSSKIYRVKSGDSLDKIARDHGTTIKVLRELNQLTNDKIIIGQKIELP